MRQHEVTTREQWLARRRELLAREKAFMAAKDELAAARRRLPWVRVDKSYEFEGARGKLSLADLFEGRSQLVVYHLMYGPNAELPCRNCSFWADNFNGAVPHLAARDVTLVAESRAPLAKLDAFKRRMGWGFNWVSSGGTDFRFDMGAAFRDGERAEGRAEYNYAPLTTGPYASAPNDLQGISVFARDEAGSVFHTYSTYGRGIDLVNSAYQLLDMAPRGRDEDGLPFTMSWVRFHDQYGASA